MRVLHLHSGNLYGGIETMLVTIAAVPGDGVHLHRFVLSFEGRLSRALGRATAMPDILGPARLSRPLTILRTRRRLAGLLARDPVDVALTHSPWMHALCGPVLRARGVRSAQWVHGPLEGWTHRWASRTPPHAVICNSRFTQSLLPPAHATLPGEVIYCPLDLSSPAAPEARAAVRAELQTSGTDVVVVQASRLEPWKGHRILLRALARLAGRPGWTAWIAGGAQRGDEAEYLQELRSLVAASGLAERVRFAGERTDVARLLAGADIYCQPNVSPEPFGLAYVEAMAAGLPVVASDAGGVREVVDAGTGVLVPPRDEEALASVLGALMSNPARRHELGAAGVLRAPRLCDPRQQVGALHRFLRSVAAPAS